MSKQRKSKQPIKKRVTFSDDTTVTRQSHGHKKDSIDHEHPPVFVRKTWLTIPYHLIALLYYYIYGSEFDSTTLLFCLLPTQVAYLIVQFNKCTIYGNKRLKINYSLLLVSIFASLLLSVPAAIIAVLFGAPVVNKLFETWLLGLHASFLSYPVIYSVFNCDFKVGLWKKYFITIIVGGWISCVVIPLDWDRNWQTWPIPVVVGIYLGAFVGYTIGSYI
ncbi:hypothetical protein KAFR_0E01310 [Kazachstania africana CBS 2517]|uniref:Glycosylphosphatidylinositol anchor biosynthesis protein 11 n=1 Tax=Kazachstania africana (strain ATCC 22294 / BCRC 22015 / CBS 2517 / CECT 1963 / NBRC 1671 / NRRL Y-8276) TaxID=1071382 RepID=H2AV85_KAZAF|nr:hypothetical protein KAFR_0E01310 [Kazachstania africana CBS 2517]CCF58285.1 hypothetical protein KAFR_0E01310 [Kazachstania africana CBS 2517]